MCTFCGITAQKCLRIHQHGADTADVICASPTSAGAAGRARRPQGGEPQPAALTARLLGRMWGLSGAWRQGSLCWRPACGCPLLQPWGACGVVGAWPRGLGCMRGEETWLLSVWFLSTSRAQHSTDTAGSWWRSRESKICSIRGDKAKRPSWTLLLVLHSYTSPCWEGGLYWGICQCWLHLRWGTWLRVLI